jgi:2-amino-4-hydroxy-6-hydroxymethyldihydropteridine diphosphokinase
VASLYRSRAVSPIAQADYLNPTAVGRTTLDAAAILSLAKALEQAAGRTPGPRFGPRPLDIDLLLYGEMVSSAPELTLPHPRLAERRFVLEPLSEIAPDLTVPPDGERVADLALQAHDEIVKVGWSRSPL